jgi:hypothetical protein
MNRITVLFVAMFVLAAVALAGGVNAPSLGPAPRTEIAHSVPPAPVGTTDATTGNGWGLSITTFTFGWNSVDLGTGAVTDITTGSADFYSGGDYDASGNFYAFNFNTEELVSINPATGAVTTIGSSPLGGSYVWEGLTYDHSNSTWYALAIDLANPSQLYTVNIATGAVTLVGNIVGDALGMIAMSTNCDGQMYGFDIVDNNFYSIDKTTAVATVIGALGFDANYAQDMDFDPDNGTCYIAAIDINAATSLRTVNLTTGATTVVGVTGYEETAFGIPGVCEGPSELTCGEISSFVARCIGRSPNYTLQWRVNILNNTIHAGETVDVDVDGTIYTSTIVSNGTHSRASGQINMAAAGTHNLTLVRPAGCFPRPFVVTCTGADNVDPQWDETESLWNGNEEQLNVAPSTTKLLGNYPNPFNPSTTIRYVLGEETNVSVKVYNMLGQEVATLVNGVQKAGEQSVVWHGTNNVGQAVSSGLYVYRIQAGSVVLTDKMLFTK